ncbi:MAG: type II secretion system F family protein [Nanoarchaeota archaeon]|nr:type II secretion system F family protein [Nanoarchaeota archaeon]
MKFQKTHWFGIVFGLIVAGSSYLSFGFTPLGYFLLVISLIIIFVPFILSLVFEQSRQKEKEEMFLAFTRDLVENVKSGTPVSKGIINLRNRNYGALSGYVAKLANQLSMGITLTEALSTFARGTKSPVISRAVALISEAERAGGRIETILESVAISVNQIDKLKKERKSSVSNLVTQGYIIFIIFIIIMLVMEFKILPLVSDLSGDDGSGLGGGEIKKLDPNEFSMPLFVTILVQSFFTGLVIGKISEGNIRSGIKHSFILLAITLLVTSGARVLFK